MKHLIFLVLGIFSITAEAQLTTLGVETNTITIPLKKATVSGTVEVVEQQTPTTIRIRTSAFNNARIFAEFSVSKNDYELVLDANGAGLLELVPKSASGGLPTLQVFLLGGTQALVDTKLNVGDVFDTMSSAATGNLFEGLGGAIRGRVSFKGSIAAPTGLKKFIFSVNAYGKNQGSAASTVALIKGKVVATVDFTQKP